MMTRIRDLYSWLLAPASEATLWIHSELKSLNITLITQAEIGQAMAIAQVEARRSAPNRQDLRAGRRFSLDSLVGSFYTSHFDFEKYFDFLAYFSDFLVKKPHMHWTEMVLMYVQEHIDPNSQQEMIDNLFSKAVTGCVTLLVKRLVEMTGPVVLSQRLVDLELLRAVNIKSWSTVRILITMDGRNKPSQDAMNDAFVRLVLRYNCVDILPDLLEAVEANKITQEAVDEALELLATKKSRLSYLQALIGIRGASKPSNEAIASALKSSIQVGNSLVVQCLIFFVRAHALPSEILDDALGFAVKYQRLEILSELLGYAHFRAPSQELVRTVCAMACKAEQYNTLLWLARAFRQNEFVFATIVQELLKTSYPKKLYIVDYNRGVIHDGKLVINLVQVLYALFLEKQSNPLFVSLMYYLLEKMSHNRFPEVFMALVLIDFLVTPPVNSTKNIVALIQCSELGAGNGWSFFKRETPEKWVCNALLDGDATLLVNKKDPRRVRGFVLDVSDAIHRYRGIAASEDSTLTVQ